MDFGAKCPGGWDDRSMLVYAMPAPAPASGVVPNVVITRDRFDPFLPEALAERLGMFVDAQVDAMRKRLREPRVEQRWTSRFKDLDVVQMRVTWLSDVTRVMQWLVFIAVSAELVVIATASAAEGEFERYRDQFAAVLGSIELGSSEPGA